MKAHTQRAAEQRGLFDVALGSSIFIIMTYIQLLACWCCITSPQPPPNPGKTQKRKIKEVDWPSATVCSHCDSLSAHFTGGAAFRAGSRQPPHLQDDFSEHRVVREKDKQEVTDMTVTEESSLAVCLASSGQPASSGLFSCPAQSKYNRSTVSTESWYN